MKRRSFALLVALALAGCSETLRVPPPTGDTTGAAGASPTGYPTGPATTGGGLVGGSGVAPATGPSSSGSSGSGGSVGPTTPSGMGAVGGVGTGMGPLPPGGMPAPPWMIEGHVRFVPLTTAPIGMSSDGTVVLGADGMLWEGKSTSPPFVVGTISPATALSADGSTVIGPGFGAGIFCQMPRVWNGGAAQILGVKASLSFVSGNGSTMAGVAWDVVDCMTPGRTLAFFWQLGNASVLPPVQGMENAEALGLSADGKAMIGHAWNAADVTGILFSFTAGKLSTLGSPPGSVTTPVFTSSDGSAFAGTATDLTGNVFAFAWSLGTGFTTLPMVPGHGQSLACGLSGDGTIVVALGTNAPSGPPLLAAQEGVPFTWSAARGVELLQGTTPGMIFESLAMAPDASWIIGNPAPAVGAPLVLWDRNGNPSLVLADAPMFRQRCHPIVTHVAADGRTIAGACDATGRLTGFVARF
jgi:uncharacterized membrane protein